MLRVLMVYLVNSVWQAPLLAACAWMVVRVGRPMPRVQHAVWLATLVLAVLLPARSLPDAAHAAASDQAFRLAAGRLDAAQSADMGFTADASGAPLSATADHFASDAEVRPRVSAPAGGAAPSRARAWPVLPKLRLSERATEWLVGMYLLSVVFGMLRLAWSWRVAWRMVRAARPAELLSKDEAMLLRCCERMGVPRPQVMMSGATASPLVVGVRRPVLLLPESFFADGHADRNLEAVWWHELVHIRRRDYLTNLICRVGMLPVAYHPAAHAIAGRVRHTREMVCDAEAAAGMQSPVAYARSLVNLAQRMGCGAGLDAGGTAMGLDLFGGGVLEERVMELIGTKAAVSGRGRLLRGAACAAAVVLAVGAAALFHVTPMLAQAGPQTVPAADAEHGTAAVETSPNAAAAPESVEQAPSSGAAVRPQRPSQAPSVAPVGATEAQRADAQTQTDLVREQRQLENIERFVSPEMQRRLQENLGKWNAMTAAERQRAIAEAAKQLNTPERQAQLQKELGRLNSQESRKQVQEALARMNTPEFQKQLAEAQKTINSTEMQKRFAEINSPQFRERVEAVQRQLKENLATMAPLGLKGQLEPGTQPRWPLTDKALYDRAMGAAASGSYEVERALLKSLVNEYPDSKYVGDAKRAIAQSWDAEGTLALVQADAEYVAAGMVPKQLGHGITPPVLVLQADPAYTPEARAAKLSGTVLVNLWVDEQGNVEHARVVRGLGSGLDEKAIEAVHQYKFKPAMEDGKPVLVSLNVEVNFRIF